MITVPGAHKCIPNSILGLLYKLHYPAGCMEVGGQLQPAPSWDHYIAATDVPDQEGRLFPNKAQRVLNKLWVRLPGTTFLNISHSYNIFEIILCSCLCAGLLQM